MKDLFSSFRGEDSDLRSACEIAINESLKVKSGEQVLIVTNADNDVFEISQSLYDACVRAGAHPVLMVQEEKTLLDYAENCVIGAVKSEPDVIISMSSEKMGKDKEAVLNPYKIVCDNESEEKENGENKTVEKFIDNSFHYLLETKKCRAFWSPGVTKESFIRTVQIDYKRLKSECKFLKSILDKSESVHISSDAGTDLFIGLKNRVTFVDDGDFSKAGRGGNLPAGEAFISPELLSSKGKIVFDGSIAVKNGTLKIEEPIICEVEKGFITSISGGEESKILEKTIKAGQEDALKMEKEGNLPKGKGKIYSKNATNLGELGIGTNPNAKIVGNMLEDEKAYNTCHIAIGSNYDEDAPALIHLDGVIKEPTIIATLENGKKVTLLKKGIIQK